MPRQRSAAVRYASKEAADSDKLLVKANRTLHVDVCCSHDHSKNTRSIAAAVGIQGWRKTMEDAHVVWLKNKNNNHRKTENDEDQEHPPRLFRSFVSGPIDCEHASTAATRRSSTATTALHADDSSIATPSTESVQQREASPAPATIYTTTGTTASTTSQMPHQHSVLMNTNNNNNNFTTSPSCSMMNNAMIDLLGDPAYLPNNNNNNNSNHVGISNPATTTTTTTTPSTSATASMNASPIRSPASANPSVHASIMGNNNNNNSIPTSQDLSHELDELSEGTSIEGFVAVFDGHGGDAASKYCCSKLGKLLFQEIRQLSSITNNNDNNNNHNEKDKNNTITSSSSISSSPFTDEELQTAFNKAFLECDDQLRNHFASIQNAEALERSMNNNINANGETPPSTNSYLESYASPLLPGNTTNAGSTAAGALILQNQIVLFSVGDCRSGVFAHQKQKNSNENTTTTTTSSSLIKQEAENNNKNTNNDDDEDFFSQFEILGKLDQDHRPGGSSAIETERLSKIPSAQVVNGRVQGKLAVSRAFGDFNFKPLDNSISSSTKAENDPLLQFPVVCIPEITVIPRQKQQQQQQSCTPLLIAIGCDGVFETQELKKLPDLIVGPAQQQHQQQVGTESTTGEGDTQSSSLSSSSPPPSLSVYGAVKVAQRSISKIQPLSEQGGLLPGSDNVTFITVYLDEPFSFTENNDNINNNNNNSNERVLTTNSSKQGEEESSSSNAPLIISPREKAKQCC